MKHIEFTEEDLQAAERYLTEKRVLEIQYSGGTYQIRVDDITSGKDVWCFLQLDDEGLISDCFCSCETEHVTCEHLAASWLKIYNGHLHPLHIRFFRSLWNQICKLCMRKFGEDIKVLQHASETKYECLSASGKRVFVIRLKTPEALVHFRGLIEGRVRETEETSLKFSKLSPEEIALWREGRPSFELRYELSFWSDLAKWMMTMQEKEEPYTISFAYSQKDLPNGIEVLFPSLEFRCYISEANLPLIIPALATVHSPLAVHAFDEEAIDYITYDKEQVNLQVHRREQTISEEAPDSQQEYRERFANACVIEDWLYVKGDGFYAREQNFLLSHQNIPQESIAKVLNEHGKLVERYLVGTKILRDPYKVSYTLKFDGEGNLHTSCYLKEPGDLQQPGSAFFGNWAYLNGEGFYSLEGVLFDEVETVVPFQELSDFVSRNRVWLNTIDGFHTHLATVDAHLSYRLREDQVLQFYSQTDLVDTIPFSKDLGDWIYVEGEGFYAKRHGRLGLDIQSGTEVRKQDIPLFIHFHRDELEHIRGFFTYRSPITRVGVTIQLQLDNTILVTPFYYLHSGYQLKDLLFFEDIVYVKDEGFQMLPMENRLPRRFRQETRISKEQVPFFITNELDALKPFAAEIDPRLRTPNELTLELSELKREGEGQLLAHFVYRTEWGSVGLGDIEQAMSEGRKFLFSKAGMLDLEKPCFQWLGHLGRTRIHPSGNQIHLSTMEMLRLQSSQDIALKFSKDQEGEKSVAFWQSLCDFEAPSPPDCKELKSQLRPYQELGLKWLWFLYYHGLAGLLCDEMGLGKTHQAMALLAATLAVERKALKPKGCIFLVVCPTSVIYHWEDKLSQFLPDLRIHTFYGTSRTLGGVKENYDLLLTSYGVLRMEHEALSSFPFEVAIFDEVQVAKNHLSMTHRALLSIKSKTRIGLTGTPIENRLRELKALFDVVLPSYMPSESQYREQFITPIEKQHDHTAKEVLARFIRPFILRRRKADVLRDLPEKTEELAYCALSEDQLKLYHECLTNARESVIADLKDDSKPIPFLPLFALLTKLKQICDHPAVALGEPSNFHQYQSGKWDLFLELLDEARESQQKVVVFTHYLSMMDIIEKHLREKQIGYASVRGSTVNRREEIRRFQENPACEVFIGSLQAVGLGVDLTAASVVIHYDRWWNAARENQATDRVHRIGQQRGVQVFKLVTKKTLEEHIDRLIEKKGQLMEEIIGSEDENQLKLLSRQEWLDLLKMIS